MATMHLPLPWVSSPCAMLSRIFRRRVLSIVFSVLMTTAGVTCAHVVPNMTIEADFGTDRSFSLRINVDPRTFLAADPTTLPPVPSSWYREQTPEQIAVTHQKAQEYLSNSLGVLFGGQKIALPECQIQAIDGADNTPLKAETQEVHLLATATGRIPDTAETFQIEFAKDANTSLILLHTQAGKSELRPQVIFPGETSRAFQHKTTLPESPSLAPPSPAPISPPAASSPVFTLVVLSIAVILGIVARKMLNRHRHHHRAHRKPDSGGL